MPAGAQHGGDTAQDLDEADKIHGADVDAPR